MRTMLVLLLALLSGCASVADAGRLVDVQVLNRTTGQPMETYRHQGRLYIAGNPGDRYAIALRNASGGRVLAVLSVDGVNAVSGETAAARQSGYVLGPWSTAEIRGWRKSLDDVAAFYFTALPDSYAARTGRPDNVGVIGVAVFRERIVPRAELELKADLARRPAAAAPGTPGAAGEGDTAASERGRLAKQERLGTGHGERIADATRYTEFQRAGDHPDQVVTLYYDSRANLMARGIIPPHAFPPPQAFPGGFVADPRN